MSGEHKRLEASLAGESREAGVWCWIASHDSRRETPGMCDALCGGRRGLLFVELKSADGRRTKSQIAFAKMVEALGYQYRLWRQEQFDDGTVARDLAEIA